MAAEARRTVTDSTRDACEAKLSSTCHPDHRGRGRARAGVELVVRFQRDHTATGRIHLLVESRNTASLAVARAVGATEIDRVSDRHRRSLIRHVLDL